MWLGSFVPITQEASFDTKTHFCMTFITAEKLALFKETFVALSSKIERTPEEAAWLSWGAQRINELEKEK